MMAVEKQRESNMTCMEQQQLGAVTGGTSVSVPSLAQDDLAASQEVYASSHNELSEYITMPDVKRKHPKDLQGLVINPIYCNEMISDQSLHSLPCMSAVSFASNTNSTMVSSEFSLMHSFEQNLSNVNSMNQLALPSIFHTSETDSEVALTLASLGDLKTDKVNNADPNHSHDIFSSQKPMIEYRDNQQELSNAAPPHRLPEAQCELSIVSSVDSQFYDTGSHADTESCTVNNNYSLPSSQTLSAVTSAACKTSQDSRPTLVLRSRKFRGASMPSQQYENFPDPERIGKKKRKKETKPKNNKEIDNENIELSSNTEEAIQYAFKEVGDEHVSSQYAFRNIAPTSMGAHYSYNKNDANTTPDGTNPYSFKKLSSVQGIECTRDESNEFSDKESSSLSNAAALSEVCEGIFDESLVQNVIIGEETSSSDIGLPDNVIISCNETMEVTSDGGTNERNVEILTSSINSSGNCSSIAASHQSSRIPPSSSHFLHNDIVHESHEHRVISSHKSSKHFPATTQVNNNSSMHSDKTTASSSDLPHPHQRQECITSHVEEAAARTTFQISAAGNVLCNSSRYHHNSYVGSPYNSQPLPPLREDRESSIPRNQSMTQVRKAPTVSKTLADGVDSSSNILMTAKHDIDATSSGSLLLQPMTFNAEKENLLGQLLKASEHCEPASLIPAGVVDDVIPAVGYRLLEVSNLSEMIRSMHVCTATANGGTSMGTIVIQEQASLREGAVSQLSVICTACQEGTVVPTSNRTSLAGDGAAPHAPGTWDINVRVQQLVQEFGLTEAQIQRMLEILGIFYRANHVDKSRSVCSNSSSSGLYCPTADPSSVASTNDQSQAFLPAPPAITTTHSNTFNTTQQQKCSSTSNFQCLEASAIPPNNSPIISSPNSDDLNTPKKKKSKGSSEPKPRTLACEECSAKFVSMNHLKKHRLSHNLAQHTCPYCHAYFKKPYNLREHIKKHENVKYKCDLCSREFTDRSSLVMHKKASHEMREKFPCTECPKVFYRRVHFTEHMRLHTKEAPFACGVCGKRFIWRDSVRKHMETHVAVAKYNCRLCGKWFRWLQSVRQHLQVQHKLKKCEVEAQVNTNAAGAAPAASDHQQSSHGGGEALTSPAGRAVLNRSKDSTSSSSNATSSPPSKLISPRKVGNNLITEITSPPQ